MADEHEREHEIDGVDGAHVADMLDIQVLMGWDGDRCECLVCHCQRFFDGAEDRLCDPCREGRHTDGS